MYTKNRKLAKRDTPSKPIEDYFPNSSPEITTLSSDDDSDDSAAETLNKNQNNTKQIVNNHQQTIESKKQKGIQKITSASIATSFAHSSVRLLKKKKLNPPSSPQPIINNNTNDENNLISSSSSSNSTATTTTTSSIIPSESTSVISPPIINMDDHHVSSSLSDRSSTEEKSNNSNSLNNSQLASSELIKIGNEIKHSIDASLSQAVGGVECVSNIIVLDVNNSDHNEPITPSSSSILSSQIEEQPKQVNDSLLMMNSSQATSMGRQVMKMEEDELMKISRIEGNQHLNDTSTLSERQGIQDEIQHSPPIAFFVTFRDETVMIYHSVHLMNCDPSLLIAKIRLKITDLPTRDFSVKYWDDFVGGFVRFDHDVLTYIVRANLTRVKLLISSNQK
ncbi:predicted protein [Naegleria gruberi]|uniref:Predicted protein n=1 Tax=Naegleria gruberi TaxID=5762 RepID=D2V5A0_NAEGR|nr:uncharacterized protein NAEGRDRAFT_64066 [Naegleria gruberi]EFC48238.1 predicted protein [Naegleria gruberi]|eukprot:XP_002680982.1 predicted protein [Naegleria gruberi strain NEG-M]